MEQNCMILESQLEAKDVQIANLLHINVDYELEINELLADKRVLEQTVRDAYAEIAELKSKRKSQDELIDRLRKAVHKWTEYVVNVLNSES